MTKQKENSLKDAVSSVQKLAKRTFSKDELDFLDDLPSGPKREPYPFPFGSQSPRPYGWESGFCGRV